MSRPVSSGTPSRTNRYLFPRNPSRLFWVCALSGLAVAVALTALVLTADKTVATPGPLSTHHAPFENKCAACHGPSVADVRCEYCHDPFGSNRYRNAGHVWFGTGDPAKIAKAATADCARCHSDHRGREFSMVRVDQRQCATCHFSTIASHPEIALVKAKVMRGEGIHFPHKRHLQEMKKAGLDQCNFCHEPTRNRVGFEPVSFDRQCARCHTKNGKVGNTDPMPASAVVLPEQIGAPWAQAEAAQVDHLARGKVSMRDLVHRDPWVLYNLWQLSRAVDPARLAGKRAAMAQKIRQLEFQLREPPRKGLSLGVLHVEEGRTAERAAGLPRGSAARRRAEEDLARIRVQIELGPLAMTAPRARDRGQIETELADRRSEIADFDIGAGAGTPAPAATGEEREQRLAAAAAMTLPCARCHVYDGALMAPVRAALPVLEHARFTHLPHVQQMQCLACHASVAASTKAEDVNLPGIASCRSCHKPGRTRDDCAECHRYHPLAEPWPPI